MSDLIEITIPEPGNTVEVEVLAIEIAAGQQVAEGDTLLEVATDKANMELEAPAAGVIVELLVAEGDIVPVTQVFARLRT